MIYDVYVSHPHGPREHVGTVNACDAKEALILADEELGVFNVFEPNIVVDVEPDYDAVLQA